MTTKNLANGADAEVQIFLAAWGWIDES